MNIVNTFDLYIDNQLSQEDRNQFEKMLLENHELAEEFMAHLQISRVLEEELYSPVLQYDNDELLNELSAGQRMEIEMDFLRFSGKSKDLTEKSTDYFFDNSFGVANNKLPDGDKKNHELPSSERNPFKQIQKRTPPWKITGLKVVFPWLTIAATIAIVFFYGKAISGLSHIGDKSISPQETFSVYCNPDGDMELKAIINNNSLLFSSMDEMKRSDDYSSSLLVSQRNLSEKNYELALIHLALSNIESEDYLQAIKYLEKARSIEKPNHINTILYYLSMTYLALGEYTEARPMLILLNTPGNYYQKDAAKILQEVKQP